MDSCSGASSGLYSGKSPEVGNNNLEERKRKRMISNRESARRSRMRKRKHTDNLTAQVSQLLVENGWIAQRLSSTGRLYLDVEAENSVLRARVAELRNRLESLNGIVDYVNSANVLSGRTEFDDGYFNYDLWDGLYVNTNHQQPLMANVGTFM